MTKSDEEHSIKYNAESLNLNDLYNNGKEFKPIRSIENFRKKQFKERLISANWLKRRAKQRTCQYSEEIDSENLVQQAVAVKISWGRTGKFGGYKIYPE